MLTVEGPAPVAIDLTQGHGSQSVRVAFGSVLELDIELIAGVAARAWLGQLEAELQIARLELCMHALSRAATFKKSMKNAFELTLDLMDTVLQLPGAGGTVEGRSLMRLGGDGVG